MMNNVILASLFGKLKRIETTFKKQEAKSFELIESITIDGDDVTAIERTTEPDGTAYSFEDVIINIETEVASASAVLTCSANKITSVGISELVGTSKKYCTVHFQAYRGLLLTSYQSPTTDKTWASAARTRSAEVLFAEAITNIRVSCGVPIPMGSKIAIYAVRK